MTLQDLQQAEQENQVFLDTLSRVPGLGFDNLIADWTYLNFIQYFGDTPARNQTGYSLSADYFRHIVHRDPRFVIAYSLLDPAAALFAGQAKESVEIMTEGLKTLSPDIHNAYLVWSYKGIDQLLFLGQGREARRAYEKAAEWATIQGDETSLILAPRFTEMAQFLAKNKDSKEAQAGSWLLVLSNSKDEKTVRLAVDQLRALGAEVRLENGRVSVSFPKSP
ncbi:MAG: hypothetical protein ACK5CA_17285 [Cyanobacteriota bacterium]